MKLKRTPRTPASRRFFSAVSVMRSFTQRAAFMAFSASTRAVVGVGQVARAMTFLSKPNKARGANRVCFVASHGVRSRVGAKENTTSASTAPEGRACTSAAIFRVGQDIARRKNRPYDAARLDVCGRSLVEFKA